MLETAYGRLRTMWPHAQIRVITWAPDEIQRTLPGAIPLSPQGRHECFDHKLFGRLSSSANRLGTAFHALDSAAFKYAPNLQALAARMKLKTRRRHAAAAFMSALQSTDLFVFSGAGMITDAFAWDAVQSLETLYLAKRLGARTAILGHMLGPVAHQELKRVCCRVLPQVDLISVRERLTSLPFLAECGVPPDQARITGDDALGVLCPPDVAPTSRSALGVNVRAAFYSGLNDDTTPQLSAALRRLSQQLGARIEPLAVAHHKEDDDAAALSAVNIGYSNTSQKPESPQALKQRIATCRVVVAGSYHAAVFALAQGIPALGLVFSPYYEAKFKGLRDLFGSGCRYIDGRLRGWDQELQMAASDLWHNAHYWEEELLRSARRQYVSGQAAYQQLRDIVEGKTQSSSAAALQPVPSRVASEGA